MFGKIFWCEVTNDEYKESSKTKSTNTVNNTVNKTVNNTINKGYCAKNFALLLFTHFSTLVSGKEDIS